MNRINKKAFLNLSINLPSLEKQQQIMDLWESQQAMRVAFNTQNNAMKVIINNLLSGVKYE